MIERRIEPTRPSGQRQLFPDALRAFASLIILWHHFALYPPLSVQASPLLGSLVDWFHHYARSTQVFFVVGGYVMARTMAARSWEFHAVGKFIVRRYCRLGIPYLAAILLAIAACGIGRGWLPESVVGSPPTPPQLVAHVFFIQEFLGFEHFSAGIWFVCINFQLGLIYVSALWLRDALARRFEIPADRPWIDIPIVSGWLLSAFALFEQHSLPGGDSGALYFMPYFFLGILVHRAMRNRASETMFWLYLMLVVAAMFHEWRWRLASATGIGLLLFLAEKTGFSTRWPKSRWIALMGRVSYSLFLVHFPVLVLVSATWARLGWSSPPAAIAGLLTAFVGSVAAAFAFHRLVEEPAAALARLWGSAGLETASETPVLKATPESRLPADIG
jgi:peptidoglycan/LPS O-acetylase OafA/YrhL